MASNRRLRAKTTVDNESPQPPQSAILLSSDDDEANEDLSLAVLESARRRNHVVAGDAPSMPLILDPSSTSDDEAPRRKKNKKKRKKEKIKDTKSLDDLGNVNEEQFDNGQRVEKELTMEQDDGQGAREELSGQAESVVTIVNAAADNAVLRKLLRGPRYFDPGESTGQTCFNCNEEGHMAVNCPIEKRQKRCFICGLLGHNGKQCKQGQDCYICKRRGHRAKDCPDKQKMAADDNSRLCLRCGGTGHDMFSCRNDYLLLDMKEVKCYVCKQNGHLCCVDFVESSPKEVSCYNCAGSGHSGLGCAKQRGENNAIASPASCYKCGEEGHFARGCNKSKTVRSIGESSAPRKHAGGNRYNLGFKSVPNDFGKSKKRKDKAYDYEDGREMNNFNPKTRGSWIVDDPGDLHKWKFKKYKDAPPRTPVRKKQRDHSFSPYENSSKSKSYNNNKHVFGAQDYQSPSSSYQKRWSASRSANSHIHFW